MAEPKILKCPYCNSYETQHAGAFNLHTYHCELKQLKQGKKPLEQQTERKTCEHSWRFLNVRNPLEQQALRKGLSEVCDKCQEVR